MLRGSNFDKIQYGTVTATVQRNDFLSSVGPPQPETTAGFEEGCSCLKRRQTDAAQSRPALFRGSAWSPVWFCFQGEKWFKVHSRALTKRHPSAVFINWFSMQTLKVLRPRFSNCEGLLQGGAEAKMLCEVKGTGAWQCSKCVCTSSQSNVNTRTRDTFLDLVFK